MDFELYKGKRVYEVVDCFCWWWCSRDQSTGSSSKDLFCPRHEPCGPGPEEVKISTTLKTKIGER